MDNEHLLSLIRQVYDPKGKGSLDDRKKQYFEGVDLKEKTVREQISYYLGYELYNDDFMTLVTKEEFLRECVDMVREPITTTSEEERLKILERKGKADSLIDKLNGDIKNLRKIVYGEFEEEGKLHIQKAIRPEERIKVNKK